MTDTPVEKVPDELDVHNGEPERPTFTDAAGTERIAGPPVENWTPAPVDPTPEQIAAMDAHNAREADRQDQAAAALVPPVAEDEAPAEGDVTEVVPAEPEAPVVDTPTSDQGATATPEQPPAPTDQQAVEAAAAADAEAQVAAQLAADQAQADDAALAAAEAQQVIHEEGQS